MVPSCAWKLLELFNPLLALSKTLVMALCVVFASLWSFSLSGTSFPKHSIAVFPQMLVFNLLWLTCILCWHSKGYPVQKYLTKMVWMSVCPSKLSAVQPSCLVHAWVSVLVHKGCGFVASSVVVSLPPPHETGAEIVSSQGPIGEEVPIAQTSLE